MKLGIHIHWHHIYHTMKAHNSELIGFRICPFYTCIIVTYIINISLSNKLWYYIFFFRIIFFSTIQHWEKLSALSYGQVLLILIISGGLICTTPGLLCSTWCMHWNWLYFVVKRTKVTQVSDAGPSWPSCLINFMFSLYKIPSRMMK